MTYTWTITAKTMKTLSIEHRHSLFRMINKLNYYYGTCEEHRDFSYVYVLLDTFRDIILAWPVNEFSAALDELNEWAQSFLYGKGEK